MKEFQLSSPKERTAGIVFSAVISVCFLALLVILWGNWTMFAFCILGSILLIGLLGFYVLSITRAKCIWDPEKKTLEVRGFPSYTLDLSNAVLLQTVARRSGQIVGRVMIFSDAEEQTLAAVPTLFTSKQGVLAEPMARELAAAMGIEFKQNVPEWEFDKEAFQQHLKEVNEQEKAEAKARRQAWFDKLMGKSSKK
jgi:hypothetical protein